MSPNWRKSYLSNGILALVLTSCSVSNGANAQVEKGNRDGSQDNLSVSRYCENFAAKHSGMNGLEFQENSARIRERSDIMMWISNLFHPSDSEFTAGYDCHFQARNRDGRVHDISVGIFLTRHLRFAEYTQWKNLQVVPIAYVVDKTNNKAGYGVFKYLENP